MGLFKPLCNGETNGEGEKYRETCHIWKLNNYCTVAHERWCLSDNLDAVASYIHIHIFIQLNTVHWIEVIERKI